uniref:Olfactory receptor n=1 Tax=Sphenodon punctatus TaxID=8508 RepID=A0A8D0GVM7_SPHPU
MDFGNKTQVNQFVFLAFPITPEMQIFLFIMLLQIYLLTLTGNIIITAIIWIDHRLQSPMYFFLSNLSILDILFTSVISPKMLVSLISQRKTISAVACITQTFFSIFLGTVEFILLAVMSFDRYVAICNPLRYSLIMNSRVCARLVFGCWLVAAIFMLGPTIVCTSLPFCKQELDHFFCDITPLLKAASCVDTHYLEILDFVLSFVILLSSLSLTIVSYTYIITTILRIPSTQGRKKAFSTCVSHITVVTISYGSSIFVYVRPEHSNSMAYDKAASLLTTVVTPLLNPFIYSLRNDKMKEVLRDVIVRVRTSLHRKVDNYKMKGLRM